MVKDITPGSLGSNLNGLTSFGGRLYFQNAENKDGFTRYYLWTSDGTPEGTYEVEGFGISHIAAIFPGEDKLFLDVFTFQYGNELYAGKVNDVGKFVVSKVTAEDAITNTSSFNASIYPNPVTSNAALQISGNTKNIRVTISDINGKKLWQSNNVNGKLVTLPTEKYLPGTYFVTVINGPDSKTIKLVKQ